MLIASDTEQTSASARSLDSLFPLRLFDASYVGMSAVSPMFVERRWFSEDLTQEPVDQFSGKRGAYAAHLTINSPSTTSFISAGSGRVRYTVYGGERLEPIQLESLPVRVTSIANDLNASIFHAWTLGSTSVHQSIAGTIRSLRNVVAAIERRSPLHLSAETEALVQRAAQAHGTPEDIATWARRLAEDVRDLSD